MNDIPVAILCGGRGTRMGNTLAKKELIDIGGRPLLWHVMRIFSTYGYNNFVLALGHQGDAVRRYFLEYDAMSRDTVLELARSDTVEQRPAERHLGQPGHDAWNVTLVDTGLYTEKAARLAKLAKMLDEERFFVAYGEAVADIDLAELLDFHLQHGRLATITGIQVNFQYGILEADDGGVVAEMVEKPLLPYWINGGFMLFERSVMSMIQTTSSGDLERELLPTLAQKRQLMLYRHRGYWQSMKTLRDARQLQTAWEKSQPWKCWD